MATAAHPSKGVVRTNRPAACEAGAAKTPREIGKADGSLAEGREGEVGEPSPAVLQVDVPDALAELVGHARRSLALHLEMAGIEIDEEVRAGKVAAKPMAVVVAAEQGAGDRPTPSPIPRRFACDAVRAAVAGPRRRPDPPERWLELLVSAEELARPASDLHSSRAGRAEPKGAERGYARLSDRHILQADEGCDFVFLRSHGPENGRTTVP